MQEGLVPSFSARLGIGYLGHTGAGSTFWKELQLNLVPDLSVLN